jgi:ribosomal protein S18 acetylase RimI-like enzyme
MPAIFLSQPDGVDMLLIRRYQAQDNKVVKELHYAGLEQFGATADPYYDGDLDDIENVYINNHGDFLVGLQGDEIVAIGAIRKFSATCGEIKRIRVRRDCQRQGYGQTILLKLIDLAMQLGYQELSLDTLANNIPAQSLFEKFGFVETHCGKLGRFDLLFYSKKLSKDERR